MQGGLDPTSLTSRRLATARCDREASCNEIGDSKQYATYEACVDQMTALIAAGDHPCLASQDREGLAHCLADIREQDCIELNPGRCPETMSASELQSCLRWQSP
jgi:hypothetical protein